jgi:hypothetical protein
MRRKILWISRHPLWAGQKDLLHGVHGKKCIIEERNFRFENLQHFFDFLEQYKDNYFIYVVVSEKWKQEALDAGYSFGTIHKPLRGKKEYKKHLLFQIEFFGALYSRKKIQKRVLGSKGYSRPKTNHATKRKVHRR